ncbi:queuine trna-ribosyltransferase [Holotrichia oblita]|nr:queuine trna-ribosyltransferase [Holotrichia oblita]
MPVGTQASVKGLSPEEVSGAGAQIMLSNTYHLFLRPGADIVAMTGGLHKFMNWHKPILTDSGGFQVFSLAALRKVTDNGVEFKSHIDGSVFTFTPENNVDVQNKLVHWLERAAAHHKNPAQALFPIIQGGFYEDLRIESLNKALPYAKHGIAIGGIAIDEPFEELTRVLDVLAPHLLEIPHYLMGAGTPDYIFEAVARGVDMFDCVYQTRVARNGLALTDNGQMNLRNAKYRADFTPIDSDCDCYACPPSAANLLSDRLKKCLTNFARRRRVRTVGGIIGRIKEIREEGPGVKTVLLQTSDDKNPAYALFDIQAIYGVIAEEGHTLQGTITPATETKAIGTASNKADVLASKKTEIASGLDSESTKTEVEQDNFNAREYVEKRNKTAKKK